LSPEEIDTARYEELTIILTQKNRYGNKNLNEWKQTFQDFNITPMTWIVLIFVITTTSLG
jgi:hypothetical protein